MTSSQAVAETVRKLESRLRRKVDAPHDRERLRLLLAGLKAELVALERTDQAAARRVASLVEAAHAPGARRGGTHRKHAADQLANSIREFEATHPALTSSVESLASALAAAGL